MSRLINITGKALSGEWGTDDLEGTGIPVLRTTNFTNTGEISYSNVITRNISKKKISEKYLRKGDIVIEKSGGSDKQPVGRVVYFEGPNETYTFNNFTGVLRVQDITKWYPKYVFYALYSNYKRGGTRPFQNKTTGLHNLKLDNYINFIEIEDTDPHQQLNCVKLLDKLFTIIKVRQDQLRKLDELVKCRFVEMFGDPIINDKNWPLVPLSSIADIRIGPFGSLLHKEDYVEGSHPLVNPSHIVDGEICIDSRLSITESKYKELSGYWLKPDDIVMGRRGEMGRCAIVRESGLLCGTGSLIIRLKNKIKPNILHKILSLPEYKDIIKQKAVGVTMPNLNASIISTIEVPLLPMNLQESYISYILQLDKSRFAIDIIR